MDTIKSAIWEGLQRGEHLTPLTCIIRYHTTAGTQRINELSREHPGKIERGWKQLEGGKRVREYWMQA